MHRIITAAIALAMLGEPALAGSFTDAQKKEIEQIVRQYLLENPEILVEMSRKLEAKRQAEAEARAQAALAAHGDLIFNNPADPVLGPKDAEVAIVEFFDYNCVYCRRALKDLQRLLDEDGKLKVVFKEFPILGPGSDEAARIALAAKLQNPEKYWELHRSLLSYPGRINGKVALSVAGKLGYDVEQLKKDMNSDEVKSIIATNMQLADALGIQGTPAFVTPTKVIRGARGYAALRQALEEAKAAKAEEAKPAAAATSETTDEAAGGKKTAALEGAAGDRAERPERKAEPEGERPPARKTGPASYVVKPGNSLWNISRAVFGSGKHYMAIYRANRDKIRDPDVLHPGIVLKIPAMPGKSPATRTGANGSGMVADN